MHSKERERTITRAGKATYNSKRWQMTRRAKLDRTPICERCNNELATEVHHRTAIADGGAEYAMENLEALCKSCHSRETRGEQILRGKGGS